MALVAAVTGLTPLTLCEVAISAAAASIMAFKAKPIGEWLGVIDHPGGKDNHKAHASPVPAVGGVIMGVSALIALIIDMWFSQIPKGYEPLGDIVIALVTAAIMILGLLDDRRHIHAATRLVISAAVFTALLLLVPNLILRAISMSALKVIFVPGVWAIPLTVLCLIALQNAVNMVDGRNGLLLGLYIIWMVHFLEHSPADLQGLMLALMATGCVLLAANCAGYLFMGDCGSYGIACFAGITSLNLYSTSALTDNPLTTGEIILMFIVPASDMVRLMFTRLRAGRSPFSADHLHLHHLLDARFGWGMGWCIYMALVGVPLVVTHYYPTEILWVIGVAHSAYILLLLYLFRDARGAGEDSASKIAVTVK